MPPGRKGPPFSFFLQSFRSGQVGWLVSSFYLPTQFSVFVRDHVGRKVVSCRGAAVKRRFPPFHWSRGGPPSPPFRPIIDRDFTDAEGSLLTKPPTWEASRQKEAARTRSCLRSFPPPCSRSTRRYFDSKGNRRFPTLSGFRNRNHLSLRLLHPSTFFSIAVRSKKSKG